MIDYLQLKERFIKFIDKQNHHMKDMKIKNALNLMFDFYLNIKVKNCALDKDQDMLLIQWKQKKDSFEIDLVRQLTIEKNNEYNNMFQLHFILEYNLEKDSNFYDIEPNSICCSSPKKILNFEEVILNSDLFEIIQMKKISNFKIEFE